MVKAFGYESAMIPRLKTPESGREILILDTIGELNDIYSIATIVFIGGSIVKHGGHNPIEPAIFERAILFGPHMFNFKDIEAIFLKNDAALQVNGKDDLVRNAALLLKNEARLVELGRNAKNAVLKNRGASRRNLEAIKEIF